MKCEVMIEDEPIIVGGTQAFAVHIGDEVGLITPETYSALRASSDAESLPEKAIEVGMRVRTLKATTCAGVQVFKTGTICIVGCIVADDYCPYRLDYGTDGDWFWYSRDMFEVIPDTEICVGDIVKTNAGSVAVVTHVDELESTATLLFATGYHSKYCTKNLYYTGKHCFHIDEVFDMLCADSESDDEED